MIGRPKGGTNRYWSKEEKLRIVKRLMNGEGSIREIAEAEGLSRGTYSNWISAYRKNGETGLENK